MAEGATKWSVRPSPERIFPRLRAFSFQGFLRFGRTGTQRAPKQSGFFTVFVLLDGQG